MRIVTELFNAVREDAKNRGVNLDANPLILDARLGKTDEDAFKIKGNLNGKEFQFNYNADKTHPSYDVVVGKDHYNTNEEKDAILNLADQITS